MSMSTAASQQTPNVIIIDKQKAREESRAARLGYLAKTPYVPYKTIADLRAEKKNAKHQEKNERMRQQIMSEMAFQPQAAPTVARLGQQQPQAQGQPRALAPDTPTVSLAAEKKTTMTMTAVDLVCVAPSVRVGDMFPFSRSACSSPPSRADPTKVSASTGATTRFRITLDVYPAPLPNPIAAASADIDSEDDDSDVSLYDDSAADSDVSINSAVDLSSSSRRHKRRKPRAKGLAPYQVAIIVNGVLNVPRDRIFVSPDGGSLHATRTLLLEPESSVGLMLVALASPIGDTELVLGSGSVFPKTPSCSASISLVQIE
ncbi:hypothetical protein [Mollivirus kamchatka]|nr:hypothetical protein [Mollivirus kamchatka]